MVMRAKAAASSTAQKRPASPMHDSDDDSSATQTTTAAATKKRRVRRPALSNDEDIAILRAVLTVQPYRASWGEGRQKWQESAARVAADTGGEMSGDLCKGRYVNLLKRFTTPQEERKRPWPKDEELKALLVEAVAEQTKYEDEAKDEFDEKGNQRRKWQPLLAMRRQGGPVVEKTEPGVEPSMRRAPQKVGKKKRGEDEEEDEEEPVNAAAAANGDSQEANKRPTRWTAPMPGAKAPVLGEAPAPAAPVSTTAATVSSSQASALASRAVASVTSSRVVSSPARLPQAPAPSSHSMAPPVSLPAQASNSTASLATSVTAPMSRSNPVVLPAILRGGAQAPRDFGPPPRQNQLPTPAPWLRGGFSGQQNPETSRLNPNAPRAPTPPTSTPPRESKTDVSSSAAAGSSVSASASARPSTASPQEQAPVDRSRNERGFLSDRDNSSRLNHEADDVGGRQQNVGRQMRPEPMNNSIPPRTSTPPRQLPAIQQPPAQMSMPHRLGLVPPPGRFPLNRYSPPIQAHPPSQARESTQTTPPRSLPANQDTSSASASASNSATPSRDNSTSGSRSQDNRTSSASSFPRFQGATSVESMLLCVLDRLSDMEKARLEDTREERELKKRELELRNRNGSGSSLESHRPEIEELTRTTTSLSTSFAVSRQEQQELQMEVSRLGPFLQASQRERAQLQQDVSLLTNQLKSVNRERDEFKSDLAAVVKTVKLLQSALLQQDEAFENYKRADALERQQEQETQQEIVARQLEQFQDALQVDRRKREEVLLLIQKERDLNEAQHRERLRQLDARSGDSGKARDKAYASAVPATVEAELAELRVAIDVERSEREREYTNLLQNIKQILAADESG